jgi:uncharacterized membrane protein
MTVRRLGWVVITILATIIAAYALAVIALPSFGPPFLRPRRADMPLTLYAHLAGGMMALLLGPWQFNTRLRNRAPRLHRWTGRCYIGSVVIGGAGAIVLARYSQAGIISHLGFGFLGVAWLATTAQAYRRIRAGDIAGHQRWMTRSYALTLAAVSLRIYLPLSQVAGLPFAESYQVIAWLCWVPNLLIAERWFVKVPAKPAIRPAPA